jgi:ketosteroid isomerase-like protein
MPRKCRYEAFLAILLITPVVALAEPEEPGLQSLVEATEIAFAKTMADRDHEGFASVLSEEAMFFSEPTVLRGKQQVAEAWAPFFEGPDAPFSWEPETVEVNESGTLALSTGPVHNAQGALVATFTSIWKQEAPGVWRIVFDKGNLACPPPAPAPAPAPAAESSEARAPEAPQSNDPME